MVNKRILGIQKTRSILKNYEAKKKKNEIIQNTYQRQIESDKILFYPLRLVIMKIIVIFNII